MSSEKIHYYTEKINEYTNMLNDNLYNPRMVAELTEDIRQFQRELDHLIGDKYYIEENINPPTEYDEIIRENLK